MKFSGYEDLKIIAEEHNAVVYSALRNSDQQSIILKALRHETTGLDGVASMYHEFNIAKNLDIPGVIQTYDLIAQQNHYALVQEDIKGISLSVYLQKFPISNLADFLSLAISMTSILGEVHQKQIIHKNIKPANFIINPDSQLIKLTDFSVASKLSNEVQDIVLPSKLDGTLVYMAPEQTGRMNMKIDYRCDFYSLGVTFYEMLTTKLPFNYSDMMEIVQAHLINPVPQIYNPIMEIPEVLIAIIHKLMAKNPAERYQSTIGL